MKKLNTNKIVALLAALCLMTSAFVGSTLAKYTSEATGTDTARVAKWSFEVGSGHDIAPVATTEFTFDLFKTVTDVDGNTDDAEVANGTSENIIAPGTAGKFDIVIKNTSEVDAQYAIDYTVTKTTDAATLPIKFSVDGGDSWTDNLSNVTAGTATQLDYETGTETITVQWKWEIGADATADTADTALGLAAADNKDVGITVSAKITATQVD